LDFLTQGLSKLTGTSFRYRSGTSRVFAGNVSSPEVVMNAQTLGPITRLTIRISTPAKLTVNRQDPKHAVIQIDKGPLDPLREQVDHRDRLIRSVAYDDSDGSPKILVETTDDVGDVRVTPAEGNEIFFVDFSRKGAAAEPAAEPAASARADAPPSGGERKLRVVVLDPGHGGLDAGTKAGDLTEKDLTLAIARKLRGTLQSRLGVTVLLTRDSDIVMDNEARSAVANNNQANLFISLHVGYSTNRNDSASSIFVMKEDFGGPATPTASRDRMFLPWYLGYRLSEPASIQIAKLMQDELSKAVSEWKFPLRRAPLGVLSSTTMPALVLEIGNMNNTASAQLLLDPNFENRLVTAIVNAIQRYAEGQTAGTGL
jgi:N-acetylmuramoyl-L-alanine amidase